MMHGYRKCVIYARDLNPNADFAFMEIMKQVYCCYKEAINSELNINAIFIDTVPFEDITLRYGFNRLVQYLDHNPSMTVLVTGLDVITEMSRDLEVALDMLPISINVKVAG